MVKVASETVTAAQFYDRYFALVESYLPKPKKVAKVKAEAPAPKVEKPAVDLGLPEQASAAPVAAPAPPAAPAEVPAPAAPAPALAPALAPAPAAVAPVSEAPAAPVVDDSQGSRPVAPPLEPAPIQVQQETAPAQPVAPVSPAL
ncbi:hypothetical protein D3C76_531470 [compost metagenome]